MVNIMKDSKSFDILSFNAVENSAHAIDVDMLDLAGNETGVVLCVIGKHSDAVRKWVSKIVAKAQFDNEIARKKNQVVKDKTLEEMQEQNIEGAAVRVSGWKNVSQEFSVELLKSALRNNPQWVDQIIEQSDQVGNFTQAR